MLSEIKYRAQLSKEGRDEDEKESDAGIMYIKRVTDDEVIRVARHAIAPRALFCIRERDLGDFRTSPRKSFPGRLGLSLPSGPCNNACTYVRTHACATARS